MTVFPYDGHELNTPESSDVEVHQVAVSSGSVTPR